ncbi:DNA polymerase III subunit alpha [Arthrobacter sp. A2-55]|uniref:DNA polymerase III subunit alpha n=1 Tax=Arthrobacter sp. A2-55 TaxID=2897337 RepID=UPI0021CDE3E8|nr:DNA polymerase III subunit alpha [Arthrobacter sp. A2-55]MCU6479083.1 DNA polymerase III subunit alpha [Arthrobacter sp. A2-55]
MSGSPSADGSGFVHLHVHTEHSSLDGLSRIKTLPRTAAALGQKAIAITDHKSLAGAWKFQKNCLEAGIKPIIGIEMYLAIGSRFEQNSEIVPNDDDNVSDADEGKEKTKRYMHLTVLACNEAGWKSLLALHNKAEDTHWYQPRIDLDLLDEHGEGLIILTGCLGGPVAGPLARAGVLEKSGDPEGAEEKRREARANLDRLITAVGREHVFLEVMYHGIKAETHAFREIRALSAETGIPMVATNDCHYEHEHEAAAHDGFLAVGVKRPLDDPARFSFNGDDSYFVRSEQQMLDVLGNIKNKPAADAWRQAVANSVKVAELCADKVIPDPKMRLPKFPVPPGFDSEAAYFHHLVKEGAVERYGTDPETGQRRPLPAEVKERLRMEEDIIISMGFPAYFLIVHDVIAWARSDYMAQDWVDLHTGKAVDEETRERKRPILVGPGRGSAAGSASSYCLKIVGIDPLEYHLLFERFLEPGRAGMPDIDVDFEAARRPEVFAYLGVRWGEDRVAHIGTFGMALSKAAIKDAARILKPSVLDTDTAEQVAELRAEGRQADATRIVQAAMKGILARGNDLQRLGNQLSALVPSAGGKAYTFSQLADTTDESGQAFRDLVQNSGEDAEEILALAKSFEGITKTESIHACGFIISPEPLDELVPLRWQSHAKGADPHAPRVICWDGGDCEEIGLLKMDVLGLTNLDIAHQAMDFIEESTGTALSLDTIPHPSTKDNPVVDGAYGLMAAGKTSGLFQMESAGMIKVAQDVVPENLDDVSAIVALFRPGPLKAGMDVTYARRKSGDEPVSYTAFTRDPVETQWIDSVMGATYGMAIYQETIMRLSTVVAGFDASQRSRLRKAMGKKKQSEMDACLSMWNEGAPREFLDEDGTTISPVFSVETAGKLWGFISGAASYLFNASHSAAYGWLAYATAYLKSGWPVEYAAGILAVADKDEKRLTALSALRDDRIEVRAPDVNLSKARTSPVNGAVLVGLAEVKGVGDAGTHIVAEREANGPFTSLGDLLSRVTVPTDDPAKRSRISVTALQGLIEAGALDSFGPRLGHIMVLRAAQSSNVQPLQAEWSDVEKSTRQRARLGTSLGIHPLVSLKSVLREWESPNGSSVTALHRIADGNGEPVLTVGVIAAWDEKGYSGGRRANFTLESSKVSINGVVWDWTLSRLRRNGEVPKVGDVVAVSGKVNVRTTMVGDEEAGTQEAITTKELSISEVWPIDAGSEPDIDVPCTVVDFAAKYRQLRASSTPTPPPTKKLASGPEQPASSETDAAAEPSNVIDMSAWSANREDSTVTVLCNRFEFGIAGEIITGNAEFRNRHASIGVPDGTHPGEIYRCLLATGGTVYLITKGVDVPIADASELAHGAGDVCWVDIPHKGAAGRNNPYQWQRLDRDVAAATPTELAG